MSSCGPELRVVYAYLETLRGNAQTAASMLRDCSALSGLDFSPNHQVTQAYERYLDGWKVHRERLQEGLDSTAGAFGAVLEGFQSVESELIALLQPETN